uniref:Major facilitator superfamily (MFS) profile domain-containing protein n=1 Tax=Kryptolebias marmoratus TaxID=37003 RepID=A0A3Q3AJK2_KRYMA
MKDYAVAVAFLGQWGHFQQVVFFLLCASIVPNGFGTFILVFLTDEPSHNCFVPDVNLTEDWRKSVIPIAVVNGKQELSKCSRYRLDVVRNLSNQGYIPGRDVNLAELEQEGCVDGWVYSKNIYQSTVVTEFDLVCSERWKQPFTSTVFFVGVLCGSFFSGPMSDRYGRKPVLFATLVAQTLFTFAQVFSTSWIMFIILLFFKGLGQISNFVAALVLGAEVLTGNVRVLYSSMGICLSFAIGYMLLPLVAYFLRDWKSLLLALLLPESPRWLLSQGRVEEAEAVIRKAAQWNKVQAPRVIFEHYNCSDGHFYDILSAKMFTMTTGYCSLSFNAAQLHSNPYVSCFISAVVEIPAYVSSWMALRYLPRRWSVIGTLILGAVPLFFIQLVPEHLLNLSLTLEMMSKYALTTGYSLIFTYTTELYPTALRNTATGTTTTVSRIGCCVTPFLLRGYFKYLPYITLGTLAVLTAFAALFLPESFKQPLPETIQQMHERKK